MINLSLDYQGFDALEQAIGDLILRAQDMRPLAEEMRTVMIEDNQRRALAGVDLNDVTFEPLTEYTLKHRKGGGPPLAPEGAAALLVTDFTVDIHAPTPDVTVIVGHWPSAPWFRYHVTGYTNARTGRFVPARNPAGITPQGQDEVATAFERFVTWVTQALAGAA